MQYAADPVAALRELRRAALAPAQPGRRALLGRSRALRERGRILAAASGRLPPPPPPPGAAGRSRSRRRAGSKTCSARAGLAATGHGEVQQRFEFTDLEVAVRAQMASGAGRWRSSTPRGGVPRGPTLTGAFAGSRQADGSYVQRNVFRYVVGRA